MHNLVVKLDYYLPKAYLSKKDAIFFLLYYPAYRIHLNQNQGPSKQIYQLQINNIIVIFNINQFKYIGKYLYYDSNVVLFLSKITSNNYEQE